MDVVSLKSYLIGPPGVGKTSTLERLTGEHLSEQSHSTGMDAPVTVLITDVLITEQWKSQGLGEQCQALCSCILKICGEDNTVQQTAINVQENSNELIPSASTELSPELTKSHTVEATNSVKKHEHFVPTVSAAEISESIDGEIPSPSGDGPSPIVSSQARQDHKEDEITSELRSLVKNKDWKKIGESLQDKMFTLLQIIDIGGQQEFLDILPLLLHGQAINLIFFDMSQEMDSPYPVAYRGKVRTSDAYPSEHTVRDVIQSALSSILSLQSNNSASAAILVGTHRDKYNDDVSDLEKSVQDSFANFIRKDVLLRVDNGPPVRYIHTLNNVSGDSSEIVTLRKLITDTVDSKQFKQKPVPTSTLILHLILRNKFSKKGWCWLKECVEIAEVCDITEDDLTEEGGILQYLHDSFGTILYYQDETRQDETRQDETRQDETRQDETRQDETRQGDTRQGETRQGETRQGKKVKKVKISQRVIVNPDVIMCPPVELAVTAFGAKGNIQAEEIHLTGEISESLMDDVCKSNQPSDEKIPTEEIVELLKSRYILHQYVRSANEKPVYFFPCLLSHDPNVTNQSKDRSHLNNLIYAPLLLLPLGEEHIPLGVFPATIVELSQHCMGTSRNCTSNSN